MAHAVPAVASPHKSVAPTKEHSLTVKQSIANAFEWVALFFNVLLSTGIAIWSEEGRRKYLAKAVDNIDNAKGKSQQTKIAVLVRCINIFSKEDVEAEYDGHTPSQRMQGKTDLCFTPIRDALSSRNETREQSRVATSESANEKASVFSEWVKPSSRIGTVSEASWRSNVVLTKSGERKLETLVADFEASVTGRTEDPSTWDQYDAQINSDKANALFNFIKGITYYKHFILNTAFTFLRDHETAMLMILARLPGHYAQVYPAKEVSGGVDVSEQNSALKSEYRACKDLLQEACNRNWQDAFIALADKVCRLPNRELNQTFFALEDLPWDGIIDQKFEKAFKKYLPVMSITFLCGLQEKLKRAGWTKGTNLLNTELLKRFDYFYWRPEKVNGDKQNATDFVTLIEGLSDDVLAIALDNIISKLKANGQRYVCLQDICKFPENVALALVKRMPADYLLNNVFEIANYRDRGDWELERDATEEIRTEVFNKLRVYLGLSSTADSKAIYDACYARKEQDKKDEAASRAMRTASVGGACASGAVHEEADHSSLQTLITDFEQEATARKKGDLEDCGCALFSFVRNKAPENGILKTALQLCPKNERVVVMIAQNLSNYYLQTSTIDGKFNKTAYQQAMQKELEGILQIAFERNWEEAFYVFALLQLKSLKPESELHLLEIQNLPWKDIVDKKWTFAFEELLKEAPFGLFISLRKDEAFWRKLTAFPDGMQRFKQAYRERFWANMAAFDPKEAATMEPNIIEVIQLMDDEDLFYAFDKHLMGTAEHFIKVCFTNPIALKFIEKAVTPQCLYCLVSIAATMKTTDISNDICMAILTHVRAHLKLPEDAKPKAILQACRKACKDDDEE